MARSYTIREGKSFKPAAIVGSNVAKGRLGELKALADQFAQFAIKAREKGIQDKFNDDIAKKTKDDYEKIVATFASKEARDKAMEPYDESIEGNNRLAGSSFQNNLWRLAKENDEWIGPAKEQLTPQALWEKHKNDKVEYAYLMDKDGMLVGSFKGEAHTAPYCVDTAALGTGAGVFSLKGGSGWHNHPMSDGRHYGLPASANDFAKVLISGATENISSKEGVYTIKFSDIDRTEKKFLKPDGSHDWKKHTQAADNIKADVDQLWMQVVNSASSAYGSRWAFTEKGCRGAIAMFNAGIKDLAMSHGLEYSFTPSEEFNKAK